MRLALSPVEALPRHLAPAQSQSRQVDLQIPEPALSSRHHLVLGAARPQQSLIDQRLCHPDRDLSSEVVIARPGEPHRPIGCRRRGRRGARPRDCAERLQCMPDFRSCQRKQTIAAGTSHSQKPAVGEFSQMGTRGLRREPGGRGEIAGRMVKTVEQYRQHRHARRFGEQGADFGKRIFSEHYSSITATAAAIVHPRVKHPPLQRT